MTGFKMEGCSVIAQGLFVVGFDSYEAGESATLPSGNEQHSAY